MAPSNYFHKPELALRRAIELQGIYQTDVALELLHDVLSSRRQRTWSLIYEQIMITYIDLCCLPVLSSGGSNTAGSGNPQSMNKNRSREVKDGLHQYRNLCQTNAPGSLEKVILYLLNKAETACQQAKAYAEGSAGSTDPTSSMTHPTITSPAPDSTADPSAEENDANNPPTSVPTATPDDLGGGDDDDDGAMDGFSASPQSILLSMIAIDPMVSNKASTTGTSTSSNTSNTSHILLPSLKFLWEIYRAILDILRSNSKLEHVYHITAQSALKFCQTYHRKMEFRHLCDMLRTHLGNLRQFGSTITATASDPNEDGKSNHKVQMIQFYFE